jgi:hypothetical protein
MTSISSSHSFAACALGALLVACSGPDEPPAADPAYTRIDDMEGGTGRIAWTPENPTQGALPGHWVSYADIQCERLEPMPEWAEGGDVFSYSALPEAHETLGGEPSAHAARLRTTEELYNTWGAGMGFQFSEPPPGTDTTLVNRPCTNAMQRVEYPAAPVDLREHSGIVFWAKASAEAGATTLLVQLQDTNTDPRGGVCDPTPNSAEACHNGFGALLELSDSFVRYELDFSELAQNPLWGHRPKPSVLDAEHVYGLYFQIDTPGGTCIPPIVCLGEPVLSFDLWIDDLYFVKR